MFYFLGGVIATKAMAGGGGLRGALMDGHAGTQKRTAKRKGVVDT